jgi:hypothetical protein
LDVPSVDEDFTLLVYKLVCASLEHLDDDVRPFP